VSSSITVRIPGNDKDTFSTRPHVIVQSVGKSNESAFKSMGSSVGSGDSFPFLVLTGVESRFLFLQDNFGNGDGGADADDAVEGFCRDFCDGDCSGGDDDDDDNDDDDDDDDDDNDDDAGGDDAGNGEGDAGDVACGDAGDVAGVARDDVSGDFCSDAGDVTVSIAEGEAFFCI
jgi:hypothetical protein